MDVGFALVVGAEAEVVLVPALELLVAAEGVGDLNPVQLGTWCFRNETQARQGRAAKLY